MRAWFLFLCLCIGCTQTIYIRPVAFNGPEDSYIPQEADFYESYFLAQARLGYTSHHATRKPERPHHGLYLTTFSKPGNILSHASFDEIQQNRVWRIEVVILQGPDNTYWFTFWVWNQEKAYELPHAQKFMSTEELVVFSLDLQKHCQDIPHLQEIQQEDF